MAFAEYVGTFPEEASHGNSKDESSVYFRTASSVIKQIGTATRDCTARTAYSTLKQALSPDSRQRYVISLIFGQNVVTAADTMVVFEERLTEATSQANETEFGPYFSSR